jgi:hypothetical protein
MSGDDEDFARYAAALYRAGQLWEAELPARELENWMGSTSSPLRAEIENVVEALIESTPDGIALEPFRPGLRYTIGRGEGLRIFRLIAIGKSFYSGYTGSAGVQITITTAGEKSIHVINENALTRYPEIMEWVFDLIPPQGWRITTALPERCPRCSYSGYSPSANTILSEGELECGDCEGAGYHGEYDEEGDPINEWNCETCDSSGSVPCSHEDENDDY